MGPISESLKRTNITTPSVEFASTSSLSPCPKSALLRAPLIDTPGYVTSTLAKSGASPFIAKEDRSGLKSYYPSSREVESPIPIFSTVDEIDLMICHQDFPLLVELCTKVGGTTAIPATSKISSAFDRLMGRSIGGKNVTIERGQYPWADYQMDTNFDRLEQELHTKNAPYASNRASSISSKKLSLSGLSTIAEEKKGFLNKALAQEDPAKSMGMNDLVQLSVDTGISISDIINYIKSRGRKEVKRSVLQKVEGQRETVTSWTSPTVGSISRPQHYGHHHSARRSPRHLSMNEVTTPPPTSSSSRFKKSGSRGRPPKYSPAQANTGFKSPGRRGRPPKTPMPATIKTTGGCKSSGRPPKTSAIRRSLLKVRFQEPEFSPTRIWRTPIGDSSTSKKRRCSSKSSIATDGAIGWSTSTSKKSRRYNPVSSFKMSLRSNTPMSDLSAGSLMDTSTDSSFLGGLDNFSTSPIVGQCVPVASPRFRSQWAVDTSKLTEESCDSMYASVIIPLKGIQEEAESYSDAKHPQLEKTTPLDTENSTKDGLNKQLFMDDASITAFASI